MTWTSQDKMRSVISQLWKLLNEGGDRVTIDALEDVVAGSIDEAVAEDSFYTLPTNEILTIIKGVENIK